MYKCKILLDSISETGKRLTTFEITFPRCVLAEAETHRMFSGFDGNVEELVIKNIGINVDKNLSRNSASSRAIPINKMLEAVEIDPFIPEKFGKPVKGMGAKEYWPIDSLEHKKLIEFWENQLSRVRIVVRSLSDIANKEDLNRLLEPFMYHTAIITATEFDNFFKLRTNEAADWKIRKIADLMYDVYHHNENCKNSYCDGPHAPQKLKTGEWHTPLVYEEDVASIKYMIDAGSNLVDITPMQKELEAIEWIKRVSVARCARVSYLQHSGERSIEKDLELFNRLITSGHWSPFEHVATPDFMELDREMDMYDCSHPQVECIKNGLDNEIEQVFWNERSGNFIGWKQYRKEFADENCTDFRK